MKKTFTLFAFLVSSLSIIAQVNSPLNDTKTKAINDKITMSGNEALNHLMVQPNPTTSYTSSNAKSANFNETIIGVTTYDLQTNASFRIE